MQQIGSLVGYAVGGPLGGIIGGMIGGLFEKKPDIYGSRLSDVKVTVSSYGAMIPVIYGRASIGGNIIWSTERIEKDTTHSQKGGGGGKIHEFSYSQSFAVVLCEGVIFDVTKFKINGKLAFNNTTGASSETLMASASKAKAVRIYKGTDTQMPDPLIQSLAGVENTSAYRGTAYIVFEGLELAEYGNAIQSLEFEVVKAGVNEGFTEQTVSYNPNTILNNNNPINNIGWEFAPQRTVNYQPTGDWTKLVKYRMMPDGSRIPLNTLHVTPSAGKIGLNSFSNVIKTDDDSMLVVATNYSEFIADQNPELYFIDASDNILNLTDTLKDTSNNASSNIQFNYFFKKNGIMLLSRTNGGCFVTKYDTNNGSVILNKSISGYVIDIDISDNFIYLLCGNLYDNQYVKKYDMSLNYIETVYFGTSSTKGLHVVSDTEMYVTDYVGIKGYGIFEVSSGIPVRKLSISTNNNIKSLYYDGILFHTTGMSNSETNGKQLIASTVTIQDVDLKDIISDLFLRSGQSLSLIDISKINQKVHGYVLTKRANLASNLQPLLQAYFLDVVGSDGVLKFVPRGGPVAAVIQAEELGVHAYGSDSPDNLLSVRTQEMELPATLNVSFMDLNGSYQVNTQYSRRQATSSVNAVSMELPLVLSADEGKLIADVLLHDAWQSRNTVTFTLPKKYIYLEPTDIIQVYKDNNKQTLRIVEIELQNDILSIKAVTEDVTKYSQETVGASVLPSSNDTVDLVQPTNLEFLDIPLLRDTDDKQGCYIATSGYGDSSWNGATLMLSNDGGKTYNSYRSLTRKATIGRTLNAFGDFKSGNIPDQLNTLTVTSETALSSYDWLSFWNGVNHALVGNEIIQFRTATLSPTQTNTYILSDFIRGKRGTEWAMNSHTVGERFVLLRSEMLDMLSLTPSEYDIEKFYKAITFNDFESNALPKAFTYRGIAQECYSPVQLGGGRDADGNIILKWVRRGRLNNEWNNKIDVPLGEDTEVYEVEILNGTNVVRTLTSNTPTVTYTSDMQLADFGSLKSTVSFTVYQLSTSRGRGFPALSTV